MAERPLPLKNRQIIQVLEGLVALDGTSSKDGVERYEFDNNLTWDIAKLRGIFEAAKREHDKLRAASARKYEIVEGMKVTEENAARVAAYVDALDELGDREQTLTGVLFISRKQLHAAGVKIPGVFAALMPILKEP